MAACFPVRQISISALALMAALRVFDPSAPALAQSAQPPPGASAGTNAGTSSGTNGALDPESEALLEKFDAEASAYEASLTAIPNFGMAGSGPTGATRPPQPYSDGTMPYQPDSVPAFQYTKDGNGNFMDDPMKVGPEEDYFAAIYSGSTRGTYFYIAGAICATLQNRMEEPNVRVNCTPLRSGGVGANVALLKEGRAQFAIVQSDTNFYAWQKLAPIPRTRSVMSLHDEMGVFVTRNGVTLDSVEDLKRLRVNVARPSTASRQLWDDLLGAYEMTVDDIGQYFEVSQDFNVQGICGNQIDAFALWIGHPASLIQEAISECNAEVKGIWGDPVASMISAQPYLFRLELPEATYHPFAPGEDPCSPSGEGYLAAAATLDAECEAARPKLTTYGFKASLLAREEARPDVVYHLVKTVIEHTEYFKSRHPALGTVNMCDMVNKGNYLEFHEGAARYYWERGWLPRGSYDPRDAECGGTVPMLRLPSQ